MTVRPPQPEGAPTRSGPEIQELTSLVYELLDAHRDTLRLAEGRSPALVRSAEVDYVRDLQRLAREVLARLTDR